MAETIGVYKDMPLVTEPGLAVVFAAIGWIIVLGLVFFTLYRWWRLKKPAEAAKKA